MVRPSRSALVLLALAVGSWIGCSSVHGPAAKLPVSGEAPGWVRSGPITVADSDTELYNLIDGGASKYIAQGWRASAYAQYVQGAWTLDVAVNDMGEDYNAIALFNFDLPVARLEFAPNAVVDVGLPSAYQTKAAQGRFYIETSVDERSDAVLSAIEQFTLAVLAR